jgi:hypothetical protein
MSSESRRTRLKETFFSLFYFLISKKTFFICLLISNLSFKILSRQVKSSSYTLTDRRDKGWPKLMFL